MENDRRLRGNACDPERADPLVSEGRCSRSAPIHTHPVRYRCIDLVASDLVPLTFPPFATDPFTVWQRVLQDQLGLKLESRRGEVPES